MMENPIMKKYLIRTALVLAAITACNKEVETPAPVVDNGQEEVTPGKVTLTFTAAISEETRTTYAGDRTASWSAGDKITVCLTNNTDYEIVDFTTADGTTFSGEVDPGYTTIVSGIYPANTNYTSNSSNYFKITGSNIDGSVIRVNLPNAYTIGSYNNGNNQSNSLTFLAADNDTGYAIPMVGKIEGNAFKFRHICGALKVEIVDIFNTLTFTTAGQTITGDFDLVGNRIAIDTQNQTSSTVTFYYGRLSTNPANRERGNRTFYIPVPDGTLSSGAILAIKNANNVSVFEKTASNNSQGITFNSNVIKKFPALGLNLRSDWSISPDLTGAHPQIHFNVTNQSDKYLRLSTSEANFESNYSGSVVEFIEEKLNSSNNTQTGSTIYPFSTTSIEKYYDDGPEKVYVMVSVDSDSRSDRKFNLDYQIYRYTVPDPATQDYLYWLGNWQVRDDVSSTPKQDLWTISRASTNSSYNVSGVFNGTYETATINCEALFENGGMKFLSQKVRSTTTIDYYLLGSTGQAADRIEGVGNDIMTATKDDANNAHLDPIAPVKRYYLIALKKADGSFYSQYGYRFLTSPAAMTRVTE